MNNTFEKLPPNLLIPGLLTRKQSLEHAISCIKQLYLSNNFRMQIYFAIFIKIFLIFIFTIIKANFILQKYKYEILSIIMHHPFIEKKFNILLIRIQHFFQNHF